MPNKIVNREMNLTIKAIDKVALPEPGKHVYYSDTREKCLRLSVGSTGAKSFVFYKKVDGYPRRMTLGLFPDMSIERARTKVAELKMRLQNGDNPFDAGVKSRAEQTVDDLFVDYLENHAKRKTKDVVGK